MRWLASASVLLLVFGLLPSVNAETSTLELYGLRVGTTYNLGPKDTPDHQPGAWGSGAPSNVYANSGREWAFVILSPSPTAIQLDMTGKVHADVWIGGGSGEAGQHTIAWELKDSTQVYASGAGKQVSFTGAGAADIKELVWDEAPKVATIPANADLTFRVYSTGTGVGLRINLADTPGWTHVALPVIGSLSPTPTSGTVYQTLSGPAVDLRLSYQNATTGVLHYNWTTTLGNSLVAAGAQVSGGSVQVAILDGANKTLLNRTLAATTAPSEQAATGVAGTWQVVVRLQAFTGNLTVSIRAPSDSTATTSGTATGTGGTGSTGTGGTGGSTGTGSTGTGASSTKASPGLELLANSVAFFGAVLLVRRRLP